jgi:uncharacterized protein (TIGR00251 family)
MGEPYAAIDVLIQPRSSRDEIVGMHDGRLKIKISAPPVDGKANERLTEVLSKAFRVPKSSIEIIRGKSSKLKTVRFTGIDMKTCEEILSKFL